MAINVKRCEDDICQVDDTDAGVDPQTTEALDIIKGTPWLNQSRSCHIEENMQPIVEHSSRSSCWTDQMKQQNDDILNNVGELDENEIQQEPVLSPIVPTNDNDIDVTITQIDTERDSDCIQEIVDDTIRRYNLNKKQKVAFEMAIENVIKRYKKEETKQLIAYMVRTAFSKISRNTHETKRSNIFLCQLQ